MEYINGILLLYKFPPGPNNLIDHVNAFERYSKFKVWKVNTLGGFPKGLVKLKFSIIMLHWSFAYAINYSNPVSREFLEYIDRCDDSYKIAFFQDEHHTCQRRFKFINDYNINCIYTLMESPHFTDVYGKYTKAGKIISTLPCYVNEELDHKARQFYKNDEERSLDIGYRGRELPVYMGKGAMEKSEIGDKFKQLARDLGLKLDIKTGEKDRINGDNWYRFISNCRAMLGVEAGVTIFDVEDVVKNEFEKLSKISEKQVREKAIRQLLEQWEDRIYYRTISPRQFELAAFRTCQILYEGRYSGVVEPMRHYIPLRKDFSNFNDVISMYKDRSFREELTRNAYNDLIKSGIYNNRKFIQDFDVELDKEGFKAYVSQEEINQVNNVLNKGARIRKIKTSIKNPLYRYFPGRDFLKRVAIRYYENKNKK